MQQSRAIKLAGDALDAKSSHSEAGTTPDTTHETGPPTDKTPVVPNGARRPGTEASPAP